jgi:hypothetical protein
MVLNARQDEKRGDGKCDEQRPCGAVVVREHLTPAERLQDLMALGYRVFHDVPGSGKWNIDHVAVGPAGVFAIETKARTKKPGPHQKTDYEVSFDGERLIFPSGVDTDSLSQAKRNAKWLAGELSKATGGTVKVRAILTLPGWLVDRKVDAELKVLNPGEIPKFIREEPATLRADAIQRIAYQLDQRCRDVEF